MIRPLIAALLLVAGPGPATAAPATCESLTALRLPDTTITTAVTMSGTFTPPQGKPIEELPSFCRVAGVIRPTSDDFGRSAWTCEQR
jgi:feruloyl esterase